jgi:hypothetical protein
MAVIVVMHIIGDVLRAIKLLLKLNPFNNIVRAWV